MAGARFDTGEDDDVGVDDAGKEDFEEEQGDKDEFLVLASLLLCFISCKRETEERMRRKKLLN